jgi:DNA-binding response OmpR family regulator
MGALEAGCDDYLKKPFNPEALLAKVTKLTSGKKQSVI